MTVLLHVALERARREQPGDAEFARSLLDEPYRIYSLDHRDISPWVRDGAVLLKYWLSSDMSEPDIVLRWNGEEWRVDETVAEERVPYSAEYLAESLRYDSPSPYEPCKFRVVLRRP